MCDRDKCRERIAEMLKINISLVDIITLAFLEFKIKYEELRVILYEEIRKSDRNG